MDVTHNIVYCAPMKVKKNNDEHNQLGERNKWQNMISHAGLQLQVLVCDVDVSFSIIIIIVHIPITI